VTGLTDIIRTLEGLTAPAALATLVRVKGSSYRKPGAQMVFLPGGAQTGLISAGCLETDVKARVRTVLASREPQVAVFDMGDDLDLIWGTGMGCQGRADVLLEAVAPGALPEWLARVDRLHRTRGAGALVTVFAAGEGAPCRVGDRFVLEADGPGLLPPPGAFRDPLVASMRGALDRGLPVAVSWPASEGGLSFLVEPILPPIALWVVGAGEHTRPLARLAKGLGWWLGVVDHRPALATAARFPEADRIVVGHPPEVFEGMALDGRSAALVVSHVYEIDKASLAALLRAPLGYLGLQGNRTRSARILRELEAEGVASSPAGKELLHWPAGLDLGGETPEAIALSMISEVQAVLAGRRGGSLREQAGPIHGQGRASAGPGLPQAPPSARA